MRRVGYGVVLLLFIGCTAGGVGALFGATAEATEPGTLPALRRASEVHQVDEIAFTDAQTTCRVGVPVVDTVKLAVFGAWAALRDRRDTLDPAAEREIGDMIVSLAVEHRESPYAGKIDQDPEMLAYLNAVAEPLLHHRTRQDMEFTLHYVDTDEVNAFAVPGGHIFVFRGILEDPEMGVRSEAELAAVLAHEIAHIDLRHTAAAFEVVRDLGLTDTIGEWPVAILMILAQRPWSTEMESEADTYAVERLVEVGYSPVPFAEYWDRMAVAHPHVEREGTAERIVGLLQDLVQSHPDSDIRACRVRNEIERALPEAERSRLYIGATNFSERVPATQSLH